MHFFMNLLYLVELIALQVDHIIFNAYFILLYLLQSFKKYASGAGHQGLDESIIIWLSSAQNACDAQSQHNKLHYISFYEM